MKTNKLYTLNKDSLDRVLDIWNLESSVYVPVGKGKDIQLMPLGEGERTEDYINLTLPVKEMVFEQKESLFKWTRNEEGIDVEGLAHQHSKNRILFGVRACDTYGIAYTDRFYLGEFPDPNYKSRRSETTIIAVNCLRAGQHCFCTSVGTGVFSTVGHDLAFTPMDSYYLVEVGTTRGQELIDKSESFFTGVDDTILKEKNDLMERVEESFPLKMDLTNLWDDMSKTFDADFWLDEANACIGCTGCTNVCPTCTCFNVVEENIDENHGSRVRYWDSCQSAHFTRNAEYHNPRDAVSRVRYRIYDKLKYIEERFGFKGCSGCGRCTDVCPTYISIIDIIGEIQKAAKENPEPPAIHQITKIRHEIMDREIISQNGLFSPDVATITRVKQETPEIKRLFMKYDDPELHRNYEHKGQFFQVTVFGEGEVPLSIPYGPEQTDELVFDFKNVGSVTDVLFKMKEGDKVGLRGPYGRAFPYDALKGRNLVFIGSGVAMAPLRTIIEPVMANHEDFKKVFVMASALRYEKLLYKDEMIEWAKVPNFTVKYALKDSTDKVDAYSGYVNDLLPELDLDWSETTALLCASPERIKKLARDLMDLGMKPTNILVTLETHMRCGAGKCGHCKVGSHYMCVDGPVFNYEEMMALPPEY
ncbi:4Fe-4S dicluster domain-containing protein [Gudongella sp. DL1XJH-153]|uniref:4Fe-4S dicluster domain-containing protein n=1 Tax=Gudongella sp. DL1XJH-153 TaxID=3409804 RepID=UPI003BB616C5